MVILRISYEIDDERLIFSAFSEKKDRIRSPNFGSHRQFMYKNSNNSKFPDVHPDRLALVALLNTLPFVGETLHIGWQVSQRFIDATKIISRIKINSIEGNIKPIERKSSGRHALSFSGGADSTAALAVMPHSTEPLFMLRSESKSRTLYDSQAALESCRQLSRLGYNVHIIESDFEYLREPIGFPTDLSVSTPAILIAESRGFESIAFGTILESSFGTSGKSFRKYSESSHYRLWARMFDSVGLGYSLPVAGISEVASSIICRNHPIGRVHQSCIRGKWGDPCEKCWKCFRKITLMAALDGHELPASSIEMIRKSKEVKLRLTEDKPIKHEGVLAYTLERASGGGEIAESLRLLTRSGKIKTDWMQHWYPKSADLIDPSYRNNTESILIELLGSMDKNQIQTLESWSNNNDSDREKKLVGFLNLID